MTAPPPDLSAIENWVNLDSDDDAAAFDSAASTPAPLARPPPMAFPGLGPAPVPRTSPPPAPCSPPQRAGAAAAAAPSASPSPRPSPAGWEARMTTSVAWTEDEESGDLLAVGAFELPGPESECVLGRGTFGTVYKVQRGTRDFALKLCSRRRLARKRELRHDPATGKAVRVDGVERVRCEAETMRTLCHPNVVRLYEALDDDTSDRIGLVLEYCPGLAAMTYHGGSGGYVAAGGGTLGAAKAARAYCDLCAGVLYLHGRGIAHRDLKPDNLLLAEGGELKIADFGCASIHPDAASASVTNTVGTLAFFSPEMCCGDGPFDVFAADRWAVGVTLYCFAHGALPFAAMGGDALGPLMDAIQADTPERLAPGKGGETLLGGLLKELLAKAVHDRPELEAAMGHPWVGGVVGL